MNNYMAVQMVLTDGSYLSWPGSIPGSATNFLLDIFSECVIVLHNQEKQIQRGDYHGRKEIILESNNCR
jgi:hypothetical protein